MSGEEDTPESARSRRPSLWHEEPFVTIRAHPRRFGWGIPLVFGASIGAGLLVADRSLSAAIALQLFLQTVGLLWLYIPPARRRWKRERQLAPEGRLEAEESEGAGEKGPRG